MKTKYSTKVIKQPALDVERAFKDGGLIAKLFGIRHLLFTTTSEVNKYDDVFDEFADTLDKFKYLELVTKYSANIELNIGHLKKIANKDNTEFAGDFIERCLEVYRISTKLLSSVNEEYDIGFCLEDVILLDIGDESTALELLESMREVQESKLSTATKSVFCKGACDVAEYLLDKDISEKYSEIVKRVIDESDYVLTVNAKAH